MAEKKEKRARWLQYAISALRRASYRLPAMSEAMRLARRGRGIYECAKCLALFRRKEVQRDHITPAVPATGWDSLDGFAKRLLDVTEGDIQILCVPCHQEKTAAEGGKRREAKKRKNTAA